MTLPKVNPESNPDLISTSEYAQQQRREMSSDVNRFENVMGAAHQDGAGKKGEFEYPPLMAQNHQQSDNSSSAADMATGNQSTGTGTPDRVNFSIIDPTYNKAKREQEVGPVQQFFDNINPIKKAIDNWIGDDPLERDVGHLRYFLSQANIPWDQQGNISLPNTREGGQFLATMNYAEVSCFGSNEGSLDFEAMQQDLNLSPEFIEGYQDTKRQIHQDRALAALFTIGGTLLGAAAAGTKPQSTTVVTEGTLQNGAKFGSQVTYTDGKFNNATGFVGNPSPAPLNQSSLALNPAAHSNTPPKITGSGQNLTHPEGGTNPPNSSSLVTSNSNLNRGMVPSNQPNNVNPLNAGLATSGQSEHISSAGSQMSREEIDAIVDQIGDSIKEHPLRIEYEEAVDGLKDMEIELRSQNNGEKEIAQKLHQARRDLGVKYKNLTPPELREYIYEVNQKRYGDPLGPSFDYLVDVKGKSYTEIIESAQRPNPNVDKLLGGFKAWLLEKNEL